MNYELNSIAQTTSYNLCLQNKFGEDECSCAVTVATKPKFTSRFTDQDVFRGEKVSLSCKLEGNPKPEIQWLFDKKPIIVSIKEVRKCIVC